MAGFIPISHDILVAIILQAGGRVVVTEEQVAEARIWSVEVETVDDGDMVLKLRRNEP